MKTFRLIGMALLAVLMCANFAACSSGEEPQVPQPNGPEEPRKITVPVNLNGLVDVEEMPMSRAEAESNDLYLIYFRQMDGNTETSYAYGLFDKTTGINVTLMEGESYQVLAVAIKNGKNKIFKAADGTYAAPFKAKLTNDFTYCKGEKYVFNPITYVVAGGDGTTPTAIANLEPFFKSPQDINNVQEGTTIPGLSLSRINTFETEFSTDEMPNGELYVSISATKDEVTYTSPEVVIASDVASVKEYFAVGVPFTDSASYAQFDATLNLKWKKADGTMVDLPSATITFKTNYKFNIKVKVDYSTTASISMSLDTSSSFSTESYYVDEGVATKE